MKASRSFYKNIRQFVVLGVLILAGLVTASAATVRGRADCVAPNGYRGPAVGAFITLFSATIGRSNPSGVGQDGMYYLYNIPPGTYALEVWSRSNPSLPPRVFQLAVYEPYTDVPVITLPC
jgi:hypothetical protein